MTWPPFSRRLCFSLISIFYKFSHSQLLCRFVLFLTVFYLIGPSSHTKAQDLNPTSKKVSQKNIAPPKNSESFAEKLYNKALKLQKAYRYTEAISILEDLKSKYPYSAFVKKARLKIADIHIDAKNFIQAQYSYQAYFELHPTDPQADYIIFQIGYSIYKQIPQSYDRDLSLAQDAIRTFDQLLLRFPNSSHKEEALKLKKKLTTKKIQKDLYIAKFYFKYKHYLAALKRFQNFMTSYPKASLFPEALAGAAHSAKKLNEVGLFKKYMVQLKSTYPQYKIPKLYTQRFVWTSL